MGEDSAKLQQPLNAIKAASEQIAETRRVLVADEANISRPLEARVALAGTPDPVLAVEREPVINRNLPGQTVERQLVTEPGRAGKDLAEAQIPGEMSDNWRSS